MVRVVPAAALGLWWSIGAHAQSQRTELSVQTRVTATDNGAGAPEGAERADLLFSLRPRVQFLREGAGLKLLGSLEADMAASARDTRRDRILPIAAVEAQASLVDRLLFLDAAMNVQQVEEDPFGVRAENGSARNARTAARYRVSPYLQFEMSPRTSLEARVDARSTRVAGTQEGDVTTLLGSATLALRPEPVGGSLQWISENTDHASESDSDLRLDRVTGIVNFAVSPDWVVGAAAGSERSRFAGTAQTDQVLGFRTLWVPGPRTEFAAAIDRRFFGTGWNLGLKHRTPRMSLRLRLDREPVTAGTAGVGGLASFLDAILTTRNPELAARGALVSELVSGRGLQGSLAGASASAGSYAQLRTGSDLTWVYLGQRTGLTLSAYGQTLRRLARSDGAATVPGAADADSRQRGASFGWNRRLTPVMSVDAALAWSRVEGLALRAGESTREASLRANLVRNLSERTTASAGAVIRRVSSNATNVSSFDETALFVGLGHRF